MNSLFVACLTTVTFITANGLSFEHFKLDSNTLTWGSARQHCNKYGMDLCTHSQICHSGNPIVRETSGNDSWVPVLDEVDDWTQIGEDHRMCWRHMARYGPTTWGRITGPCPHYATSENPCPLKKHVLCCSGIEVDTQLATWDSSRAYCKLRGRDLCTKEQICQSNIPNRFGELSGYHRTAIRNKYNHWVSIDSTNPCSKIHGKVWGTSIEDYDNIDSSDVKTRIVCCEELDNPPQVMLRPDIFHFYLKSSGLTWTKAKEFCENIPGLRMCFKSDVCPDGLPVLTVPLPGDHWVPITDKEFPTDFNNWIEIGTDNWRGGRVCWTHDRYGPTAWGDITGPCGQWATATNDCPHKGNVFCCK